MPPAYNMGVAYPGRMYVNICGKCDLLWCPVIMVNYEDGGSIFNFFGCHSGPVNGFDSCIMVNDIMILH